MSVPHYLFVDDATGQHGDGERYRALLNKEGELLVTLVTPDRATLLAREAELQAGIDGYILDINLRDHADQDGQRFLGTGAGLAQDLRLLQALGPDDGQRARPVVRLCAAQVFQDYLAGDNSTVDIFDLGFDKENIGDHAAEARLKLSVLPGIYQVIYENGGNPGSAAKILGLDAGIYEKLHSRFRVSFETELTRKPHEAVSFLLRQFLDVQGLLLSESLLAVRLGVDLASSDGWRDARALFDGEVYRGVGHAAFRRWWAEGILARWAEISPEPLFRMTAPERVGALEATGLKGLKPLVPSAESPGDRPWQISLADDPQLRLPADLRFAFPVVAQPAPWIDEPVWCLEQAKRNRNSPQLSQDARTRLNAMLKIDAAAR